MIELPVYARVVRDLPPGEHAYLALLPLAAQSPAMRRIESSLTPIGPLLAAAQVRIRRGKGYVWIDDEVPAIILIEQYYRESSSLDLYLDLLHELTHLRQLSEGHSIWDDRLPYVDRRTEIEGYAVAVEEGCRLGMTEEEVVHHLSNPWMTHADVRRLLKNVRLLLSGNDSA